MHLWFSLWSISFKGLFSKFLVFILVVLVLAGIFVSPFLVFEESSNYNYYKVVSYRGELSSNDMARIARIDSVFLVLGFGYASITVNGSEFFVVWVSGPAEVFLRQYLLIGSVHPSQDGILVSISTSMGVGDSFSFNGSQYKVMGVVQSRLFNDIFDYEWTVPFIIMFSPLDSYKVLLVWVNVLADRSKVEANLIEACGENVFITTVNKMQFFDRDMVLFFTIFSFASSFAITYLFTQGYRDEFAIFFGVGWKAKHVLKIAYARYVTVSTIGYILALATLLFVAHVLLNIYFFTSLYLAFPLPTIFLNLLFIRFQVLSFTKDFVEVLNG